MFGFLKRMATKASTPVDATEEKTSFDVIEKYKDEISNIEIDKQPFRLSGLLHILTNRVSDLLKDTGHTIYYDVESEVGRYIVGDNDYIEQVLEILIKDALSLNRGFEVMLKVSKYNNKFLVFEVINEKGFFNKDIYQKYLDAQHIVSSQSLKLNSFIKAKKIVEAMDGEIVLKNSRLSGINFTFKIPYYEDKDNRSNTEELKKFLTGKKALFIGKSKHDTQRAQYIFKTYGIDIENINLEEFEKKRPDLRNFDMAIMRSGDLTYKHVSFFKNIYQDTKSNFKIIIVHELFEDTEKVNLSKSIAHAELYNPTVIGDVEEILYQMFILKSKAVKGINNMEIFNPDTFKIKGNAGVKNGNLDWYKGAHIAIVEDSKVDQRVMKNILNFAGVTLYCLDNGAEMLKLLENEEIDIIFSDINMPIMDGLIMTRNIRSNAKWKHIPIISISSMAFSHEIEEMKVAGMNASIAKPIEAEEVYVALENFLIMTAKIRNREISPPEEKPIFTAECINFEKGLQKAQSESQYQENLLETMRNLKETRASFEKLIKTQQLVALRKYVARTLFAYEGIYATEMIKMFKELNEIVAQKQVLYFKDYIGLYRKNWEELEKAVSEYIESSTRE